MEAIAAAASVAGLVGFVARVVSDLNHLRERRDSALLNIGLVSRSLSTIKVALESIEDWRITNPESSGSSNQLDHDLNGVLVSCALFLTVIDRELGDADSKETSMVDEIRLDKLDSTLKEFVFYLNSQSHALQLLLSIFQHSTIAEQEAQLNREETRSIFRLVQEAALSIQPRAQDIQDAASILSGNPSVNLTVDPILLRSPVYRKLHEKLHQQHSAQAPSPPDLGRDQDESQYGQSNREHSRKESADRSSWSLVNQESDPILSQLPGLPFLGIPFQGESAMMDETTQSRKSYESGSANHIRKTGAYIKSVSKQNIYGDDRADTMILGRERDMLLYETNPLSNLNSIRPDSSVIPYSPEFANVPKKLSGDAVEGSSRPMSEIEPGAQSRPLSDISHLYSVSETSLEIFSDKMHVDWTSTFEGYSSHGRKASVASQVQTHLSTQRDENCLDDPTEADLQPSSCIGVQEQESKNPFEDIDTLLDIDFNPGSLLDIPGLPPASRSPSQTTSLSSSLSFDAIKTQAVLNTQSTLTDFISSTVHNEERPPPLPTRPAPLIPAIPPVTHSLHAGNMAPVKSQSSGSSILLHTNETPASLPKQEVIDYIASSVGIKIGRTPTILSSATQYKNPPPAPIVSAGDLLTSTDTEFSPQSDGLDKLARAHSERKPVRGRESIKGGKLGLKWRPTTERNSPKTKTTEQTQEALSTTAIAVDNSKAHGPSSKKPFNLIDRLALGQSNKTIKGSAINLSSSRGNSQELETLLSHSPKSVNLLIEYMNSQLRTPLMVAAINGHIKCMEICKDYGADFTIADKNGRTALHLAVEVGRVNVVDWILQSNGKTTGQQGIRILERADADGSTPLHIAARLGNARIVDRLLASGASSEAVDNWRRTPLHCAVIKKQNKIVIDLIGKGSNVHATDAKKETPLIWAVKANSLNAIKILLEAGADRKVRDIHGDTVIHHAARLGHLDAINGLHTDLRDLEARNLIGESPLHFACLKNQVDVVAALVQIGVEVNSWTYPPQTKAKIRNGLKRGELPGSSSFISSTPLHYACLAGHESVTTLLLHHRALVNAPQMDDKHGKTPLMLAVEAGSEKLVTLLLTSGAEVNAGTARECITALHIAAKRGNIDIIRLLIQNGANLSARTSYGETPGVYALRSRNVDEQVRLAVDYISEAQNLSLLGSSRSPRPPSLPPRPLSNAPPLIQQKYLYG